MGHVTQTQAPRFSKCRRGAVVIFYHEENVGLGNSCGSGSAFTATEARETSAHVTAIVVRVVAICILGGDKKEMKGKQGKERKGKERQLIE